MGLNCQVLMALPVDLEVAGRVLVAVVEQGPVAEVDLVRQT